IRTWSVSGTALALCTRSSSLSMSTSTSISGSLLLRRDGGSGATGGIHLPESPRYRFGHQLVDPAPEGGDLLDAAGGDEAVLRPGHQVARLHVRRERPVQVVHLELPLEVGDHSQSLDHRLRPPAAGLLAHDPGE